MLSDMRCSLVSQLINLTLRDFRCAVYYHVDGGKKNSIARVKILAGYEDVVKGYKV